MKLPRDIKFFFSPGSSKYENDVAACFLAESPLIVCNFDFEDLQEDPYLQACVDHELEHFQLWMHFLPTQALIWQEIHALNGLHDFLQENENKKHLIIPTSLSIEFSPIGLTWPAPRKLIQLLC